MTARAVYVESKTKKEEDLLRVSWTSPTSAFSLPLFTILSCFEDACYTGSYVH